MNPLTHSKNSTILPLLAALGLSSMTASASQNLPFRLGDEGTITFTSPSTATTAGTGNATHLGRITSDGNLTIVGEASCIDNEVGFAAEMQDTFTAANGDMVTTAITMQLCPIAPGIYHGGRDLCGNGWYRAIRQCHRLGSVRRHRQFQPRHHYMRAEGHHFDEPPLGF
jgi:hypothetical protein